MVEKISVQIALEGSDEIKKQLADIGEAGSKAFVDIGKAGDSADGIARVGEASQTAAEGINQSSAAADKASESMSKFSLESVKTASEIAKNTAEIAKYGVEIGLAVQRHRTLIESFIHLATGANTAVKAVSLLAPELTLVGAGVLAVAIPLVQAVAAFEVLEKAATKFAASDEKVNDTLQTLAAISGVAFSNLQEGQATFEQIGIKAETFRGTITKIQETLATVDTKNLTKGMSDIVALVNQIAAGNKDIKFADWVTAEDKVKGVSIAMKQAADSGKDATQVLLEFIRNADLATGIKVGAAFGLSEADVQRVRNLKENISDLIQRVQGAGPLISPAAAAAFEKMRASIANADSAWIRFKQSLDSTIFSSLAASLSSTMNDMKAAVLNGAASITEGFGQAFRGMSTQASSDVAAIGAALSQLGQQTGVTGLFRQMQADAGQAETAIANFIAKIMSGMGASEASIRAMTAAITGVTPAVDAAGQATQQAGVMFTQWGTVAQQGANTAQAGIQQTSVMFTSFGTVASQSGDKAKASMEAAAGPVQSLSDKVSVFSAQIASIAWDNISGAGVEAWNALSGAISGAYDWFLKYLGLRSGGTPVAGGAPIGSGGIGSNAGGGLLGGRGTGTSDSNLAWVSRGEHIMPARAVAQPGVLALLEALRRSGGNLSNVLDGMGQFALGGMVPRAIPAFAGGGLARGMSNVTIQFPGLPDISGLRASSDVVDQLQKAAALAQVRSGGRKPSRYS